MKKGFIILYLIAISNAALGQCAKYEPQDGKIMLIIGQDMNATGKMGYGVGYSDDASLGATAPAGVTTYYSTTFSSDPNVGIYSNADWGAGALCASCYSYSSYFDNSVIVIGLYMVNDLGNVINGYRDSYIDALGNWIKSVSPRPVFLRIGYEFDYQYGCCPTQYIQAWQHIVDRFRNVLNVSNVAYVWQASSGAQAQSTLLQWYPGDSYVDWFAYSHFYGNSGLLSANLINLARIKRKPVMIAEATPYGYDLSNASSASSAWSNYFSPLFSHINNNIDVIKALAYINQDWDAQPAWTGQGWGNSRVQANGDGAIKSNWLNEMNKSYWLHGSSFLFSSLQNSNTQLPFGGVVQSIPGTIQAEDFDTGCEGLSYYDNSGGNYGGSTYRYGYSVDIGPTADISGSYDVGWTSSSEWLSYTVNISNSGNFDFKFRFSTANSGNTFHIEQDGIDVSGSISVPNTGSWSTYSDLTVTNVPLSSGSHVIKIFFDNVSGFNINYFGVSSASLPITIQNFNSIVKDDGIVNLEWTVVNDDTGSQYAIERSEDGVSFHEIGKISGGTSVSGTYLFFDTPSQIGIFYYQIKEMNHDGSFAFSTIVTVNYNLLKVDLYPNPCSEFVIIEYPDLIKAEVLDMTGRPIMIKRFDFKSFQHKLYLDEVEKGPYLLKCSDKNGNVLFGSLLIKN